MPERAAQGPLRRRQKQHGQGDHPGFQGRLQRCVGFAAQRRYQLHALVVEQVHAAGGSGVALQDMEAALLVFDEVETHLPGVAGGLAELLKKGADRRRGAAVKVDPRAAPDPVARLVAAVGAQLAIHQHAEAAVLLAGDKLLGHPGRIATGADLGQLRRARADQGLGGEARIGRLEHQGIVLCRQCLQRGRVMQHPGRRRGHVPALGHGSKIALVMQAVQQLEVAGEHPTQRPQALQAVGQVEHLFTGGQQQVDGLLADDPGQGLDPGIRVVAGFRQAHEVLGGAAETAQGLGQGIGHGHRPAGLAKGPGPLQQAGARAPENQYTHGSPSGSCSISRRRLFVCGGGACQWPKLSCGACSPCCAQSSARASLKRWHSPW